MGAAPTLSSAAPPLQPRSWDIRTLAQHIDHAEIKGAVARLRATLNASRAAAAAGTGTFTALAASTISVRSLCARSIVKPGSTSPFSTFMGHAISCPLVAVVPWITSSVFSSVRPNRCESAMASALS